MSLPAPINDKKLIEELERFGETGLWINHFNRDLLIKKLNHYKAREQLKQIDNRSANPKQYGLSGEKNVVHKEIETKRNIAVAPAYYQGDYYEGINLSFNCPSSHINYDVNNNYKTGSFKPGSPINYMHQHSVDSLSKY
jgi:hypothetical protein